MANICSSVMWGLHVREIAQVDYTPVQAKEFTAYCDYHFDDNDDDYDYVDEYDDMVPATLGYIILPLDKGFTILLFLLYWQCCRVQL